jgi:hypothetical protein
MKQLFTRRPSCWWVREMCESSQPWEMLSQGWEDWCSCNTGLDEAKSKFGMKPKLSSAVATVLMFLQKAKVYAYLKAKLRRSEGFFADIKAKFSSLRSPLKMYMYDKVWSEKDSWNSIDHLLHTHSQCCGSGSGRIRTFLPDPEISPLNPDPDPALVVFLKDTIL